ncbi:hypothetical protein VUR80DRAFT_5395 [Thermomyces stellatus]
MATAHHDSVPGTILLVDAGHGGEASGADIFLQPRPSADPEDPLNWSRPRKLLAIGMVYVYVLGVGIATAVQYSVLTPIADAQGLTVGQLNLGTGLMFLFLGWGCLLWQPIAMRYGRRGVYIVSTVLSIIPMVWAPHSTGSGQWYAHRILLGLFSAPVESLPEVSVPDLFFAHERGAFMGGYAFLLFGSNFLAPLFAGFINDGLGWEWVMYFGALVLSASALLLFFFLEDTIYFRETTEGDSTDNGDSGGEKSGAASHDEAPRTFPPPRSYVQKLNLVFRLQGRPTVVQTVGKVWRGLAILVHFPNIVWAGFLYGLNLAWYNIMNGTTSSILGGPPYNWPAAMVGVAYVSPILGALAASIWSGWFADWVALRLARRNGGIREPEHRLWVLLVAGLLSTGGLLLWGVGAAREVHFMGLMVGIFFVAFGVVTGGSCALAYAVDCFKEIAGESLVTVIIIRNTIGFAFNYAINPWIDSMGLQNCFISVSMLALLTTMSFLLMIVWGKNLRRASSKKYWEYVAKERNFPGSH